MDYGFSSVINVVYLLCWMYYSIKIFPNFHFLAFYQCPSASLLVVDTRSQVGLLTRTGHTTTGRLIYLTSGMVLKKYKILNFSFYLVLCVNDKTLYHIFLIK